MGYAGGVVLTCLCRRRCWPAHHIPETRSSALLCPHCSYNQSSSNMHISDNYVHTCNCQLICKTTTSYLENYTRSYHFNRPRGHPFDSRPPPNHLPAIFTFNNRIVHLGNSVQNGEQGITVSTSWRCCQSSWGRTVPCSLGGGPWSYLCPPLYSRHRSRPQHLQYR